MTSSRVPWLLAGLVAGFSGLATSVAVAAALSVRESPVVAVAELVIRLTPGPVAERAIGAVGTLDKPILVVTIVVLLVAAFAVAGLVARRRAWVSGAIFTALAVVGGIAVLTRDAASSSQLVPILVGFVTWQIVLAWLVGALRHVTPPESSHGVTRRGFLARAGLITVGSVVALAGGRVLGKGRQRVESARSLLRLDGVTMPKVPGRAVVDVEGVAPWMTPNGTFYQIHTAITAPAIDPTTWRLRIHGMVDREIQVTYQDLLDRQLTEAWITLNCVSNPVGGNLIGNAWWSGVRVADLLAEAGVRPGADAVLQTSEDGWTCGTPIGVLTDSRDAMLAIAMNGQPLPIDHGFPVRVIVPGLYGFVSATKWVVDLKVTRFDRFQAYWTGKGWAEQAPVKMASRIDVPRSGQSVPAGTLRVGGSAWAQHTGIEGVQVAIDGGQWQSAVLARVPSDDTWVQWAITLLVDPGDHILKVRAIDATGTVQTGVERDVVPDGATGWDTVDFVAEEV